MKKFFLLGMLLVVGGTLLKLSSDGGKWEHDASNVKEEGEEHEKESGADRQMSSWWWSRAYPDPTDINHKYYSGWLQAKAMRNPEVFSGANAISGANGIDLFSGNWTPIGPSQNIGGRIPL